MSGTDWSQEVEQQEQLQNGFDQRRRRSLERYRPGALSGPEPLRKPKPPQADPHQEQQAPHGDLRQHGHARGRGGRGRGRGGRGGGNVRPQEDVNGLESKLGGLKIADNDLRHRLNQRSRNPEPPPPQANGDQSQQQQQQQQQQPQQDRRNHRRVQGRGAGGTVERAKKLQMPKRNTENFNPSHAPPDVRIKFADIGLKHFNQEITTRDVVVVTDLFGKRDDMTIYNNLLKELENAGGDPERLWQSWHGDSHVIADDKKRWKQDCPTFNHIIDTIANYFNMDIKATRLNWYRDSSEWKPFHHDAAAVKPDKAKTQNFTVAVSFGMEREAAFEHAQSKNVVSMPQPNGMIYTFSRDVNIIWRHGILQVHPDKFKDEGRISIIAWGWIDMIEE